MFSSQPLNVYEVNGYQYWPAWMYYNLHNLSGPSPNNLPLNFISLDSTFSHQQSSCSEKQTPPSSPKLGFIEYRAKEKSETTNCQENSRNSRDDDILSDNEGSSFVCKKKKTIVKKKKTKRGPQNKNRNIIPSVVQQIFSFLSKPTKSKPLCQKVFQLTPKPQFCEVSTQRYYYYIKQVKEKLNHYVNEKSLTALHRYQEIGIGLFPKQEQIFYLKLSRILAKHFIEQNLPYLILHSKRMFEDMRIEHLKIRRSLLSVLQNLDC